MKAVSLIVLLLVSAVLFMCQTNQEPGKIKSNQKEILGPFVIYGVSDATYSYNATTFTYTFRVPGNTDIKDLKVLFLISDKATISPDQNVARDYTNPVIYTVTAEDGSKQNYAMRVEKQLIGAESSEKEITSFLIDKTVVSPVISASIDQSTHKITAFVPTNTDLTRLLPIISVSYKANVTPASRVLQNFTNSVKYKVTAQDGSTQDYEVKISNLTPSPGNIVPTGFGCLVTRIEASSGAYCTFSYDELGRVVSAVNTSNLGSYIDLDGTENILRCTYNGTTNELTEASLGKFIYKFFYKDGKLSYVSYKEVTSTLIRNTDFTLNNEKQITRLLAGLSTSSPFCNDYVYQNGALIQRKRCSVSNGNEIIEQMEYDNTRSFIYPQRSSSSFTYIFNSFMLDFDRSVWINRNSPFFNFGYYLPVKINYLPDSGPVSNYIVITSIQYEKNSYGYPTTMKVNYVSEANTVFPNTINSTYKITYGGCQ